MKNFSTRADGSVWTPVSEPPAEGVRVAVTHAGDVFKTETTGKLLNGKWRCACGFMIHGGVMLAFNPTHWRSLEEKDAA